MTETNRENVLNCLHDELIDIAAKWREANIHKYYEERDKLTKTYHIVMHELFALGWDGILDLEGELPDSFMPEEYFRFWDKKNSINGQ